MNSIISFKARKGLEAAINLAAFIDWAKITLPLGAKVKDGIQWDADTWTFWGINRSRVSSFRARKGDKDKLMAQPFRNFAKAVMVHRAVKDEKTLDSWDMALKALEASLREITGNVDVTQTNAAVCAKACDLMRKKWPENENGVYYASAALVQIMSLLREKHMLSTSFRWSNPVPCPKTPSLDQQEKNAKKKLPSDMSLVALGEIFYSQPTLPLDIIVTSSVALLLSAPGRIGELAYITYDVEFEEFDPDTNDTQLYLRWYGLKGFGDKPVPVIDQMRATCEEAIRRVRELTHEGRAYAKWLEDHPHEFPPHQTLPDKSNDEPLSIEEACDALMLSYNRCSPRSVLKYNFLKPLRQSMYLSPKSREIVNDLWNGLEKGRGRTNFVSRKNVIKKFDDKSVLTLRKLNVLMREKYLPRTFPFTDGKQITKYSDSLFTMKTGILKDNSANTAGIMKPLGIVLGCERNRLNQNLTGSQSNSKSIFERWHYPGVSVSSHAFRHYLNTAAQRVGLSDVLIAAWSGRVDVGQNRVYNHETIEEQTQAVAQFRRCIHANGQLLEKIRTSQPLNASDLADLKSDQDRILHEGAFGVCAHDFSESPCPKMGACLACGKLACIKGDEVKLNNLKVEREQLESKLERAKAAEERGDFGAQEWVKQASDDLFKCKALIALLENPDLADGSIIWNQDNGWTLTTNALAMKGLLDLKEVTEIDTDQPPQLTELMALMER